MIKGAKEVVITDLPQLVGLMEENIKMNSLDNCKAAALTWGDDPAPFNPPFDVILIADVVRPLPRPNPKFFRKTDSSCLRSPNCMWITSQNWCKP